jgi:hypothetical protein
LQVVENAVRQVLLAHKVSKVKPAPLVQTQLSPAHKVTLVLRETKAHRVFRASQEPIPPSRDPKVCKVHRAFKA